MSSGFLLLETVPGKEREVLDRLGRLPEVAGSHVLFRASVAVKLVGERERVLSCVEHVRALDGVLGARHYPAAPPGARGRGVRAT